MDAQKAELAKLLLGAENDPMANPIFKSAKLPGEAFMANAVLQEIIKKMMIQGRHPYDLTPNAAAHEGPPDTQMNAMIQRVRNGKYHGE